MSLDPDPDNEFERQGVSFKIITEDMFKQVTGVRLTNNFLHYKNMFRFLTLCGYIFSLMSPLEGPVK